MIEIENDILAASTPIGSPIWNQNKVKELITFHGSLIGKFSDKSNKMASKMTRHKSKIENWITKTKLCIKNSKEARKKKDGQSTHQYKAKLEVYKEYLEEMKTELLNDYDEQEQEVYQDFDEKLRDINLKIVAEIANDDYFLVEKETRMLTYKLDKIQISKYKGELQIP